MLREYLGAMLKKIEMRTDVLSAPGCFSWGFADIPPHSSVD
jgi:hypothetical protein